MPKLKNRQSEVADQIIQQYVRNSQGVDSVGLPNKKYISQRPQYTEDNAEDYADDADDDFSQIQDYSDNDKDYSSPTDQSAGANSDLQNAEQQGSANHAQSNDAQDGRDSDGASRAQRQTSRQENAVNYRGGNAKGKASGGIKGAISRKVGMWILGACAAAIIGLGAGGATSASLLLQSIVQRIDNSILNVGDWASDWHSRKVLKGALKSMQGCKSSVFKACDRFKPMSERQQKKFKQNGWKMYDSNGQQIAADKISGKQQVAYLEPPDDIELPEKVKTAGGKELSLKDINGKKVLDADTIIGAMDDSASLRKGMTGVYNPRFGSFSDGKFMKFMKKFRLKKHSSVDADTPKEMDEQLKKTVDDDNNKTQDASNNKVVECSGSSGNYCIEGSDEPIKDKDGKVITDKANAEKVVVDGDSAFNAKKKVDPSDDLEATKNHISDKGLANKLSSWFSAGGDVSTYYCSLYNGARGVSTAIKMYKSRKMIAFAFQFLTTASAIMAGKATAEQVQYLGNKLTTVTKYDNTNAIAQGSGMDAANMKYALYQEKGDPTESSMDFKASLTQDDPIGLFITVMKGAVSFVPGLNGDPGVFCDKWMSSTVQTGLLVTGIASTAWSFVPGAGWTTDLMKVVGELATGKLKTDLVGKLGRQLVKAAWNGIKNSKTLLGMAAGLGADMAFDRISEIIPTMITNAMVGGITDGLVGERAGDALATGYDEMFSKSYKNRGGAPLSTNDAKAYKVKIEERALAYAEQERVGAKWYDIYNPYTALGSVTSELAINMSGALNSPSMFIKKVANVVNRGYASIKNPLTAKAEDATFYQCADPDYSSLGLACDNNGTLVYGQTKTYNLEELIPELYSKDLIDEEGNLKGNFLTFEKECIESDYAPGTYRSSDKTIAGSRGENCINGATWPIGSGDNTIDVSKLYDYYQDLRSQEAMDNEPNSNGDSGSDSSSDISTAGSQDPTIYQDKFLSEHPNGCSVGYCTSSNGCTTISAWFISEHTSLNYGHGNGNQVVDQLVAANPDKNLQITNRPTKVPAIFSSNPPDMNAAGADYGHTGLVTAINEDGTIQTLEAGASMAGKVHTQTFTHKPSEYSSATKFVYVGDYLK